MPMFEKCPVLWILLSVHLVCYFSNLLDALVATISTIEILMGWKRAEILSKLPHDANLMLVSIDKRKAEN